MFLSRRVRIARRALVVELLEHRQLLSADTCLPGQIFEGQTLPLEGPAVPAAVKRVATVRPEWAPQWDLDESKNTTTLFEDAEAGAVLYTGWRAVDAPHPDEDGHDHNDEGMLEPEGYGLLDQGGPTRSNSGAAPNFKITNIWLREGNGTLVSTIPVGQMVTILVQFSTEGIPANTPFDMQFEMDGVSKVWTDNTWASGNGNWFAYTSGWYAGPGQHNFSVTIDSSFEVSETDESDNYFTKSFVAYQPQDFNLDLLFPSSGIRNELYAVNNYADVDPRDGSQADFAGGIFQYDGHNAWDLGPINFSYQDAGLPLVAVADGIVKEVSDGNFDRKTNWDNTQANYVIIDHGNNWNTIYWHMARDSVAVQFGQSVKAGDVIGDMGSSGISTGTHVHYTLTRYGLPVETMYDTDFYYHSDADVAYQPTTKSGGINGNINNDSSPTASEWREGIATKRIFNRSVNEPVVFDFAISHLLLNETIFVRFVGPNNATEYQSSYTAPILQRFPQFYWWVSPSVWTRQTGMWRAEIVKDGEVLISEPFEVTDGASPGQILVQDASGNTVNPGRTTPIDFGRSTGGTHQFRIFNHGNSALLLGAPEVPPGFALTGSFPSSIAPGASSTFTLQFTDGLQRKAFGAMRFTTSDPDLPEFWFNVEGAIPYNPPGNIGLTDFNGPAVAYQLDTAPVPLVPNATFNAQSSTPSHMQIRWDGGRAIGDAIFVASGDINGFAVEQVANNVFVDGVQVGQVTSDGVAPAPLEITFNGAITPAIVQALMRSLNVVSTSNDPGPRYVSGRVWDTLGVPSTPGYISVRMHEPIYDLAQIDTISINGTDSARSRIEQLEIAFDDEVTILPGAFEVTKTGVNGGSVDVNVSTQVIAGRTVATLTFAGSRVTNGSLVDGTYELDVLGDLVIGRFGQTLDGNNDGLRGGDYRFGHQPSDAFFRLFGDSDGDRDVDFADFLVFRSVYGSTSGDAKYDTQLDEDQDGDIDFADFLDFRSRYGTSL